MKYTTEQLEQIAAKLQAMPPVEKKKEHSKQESVRILKKEIVSLQKRGYTLEQVAEALRGEGFEISTPTLKSYLQRTKRTRKALAAARDKAKASTPQAQTKELPPQKTPETAFAPRADTDDI